MERKLLNEIERIADLMSVKTILTEQPIVAKILRGMFKSVDDDAARQLLKTTDNSADDLIRKIRNGENLSDDALELLYRKIDYTDLAKTLLDNKALGSKFDGELQRLLNVLKDDPSKKDAVLDGLNKYFDGLSEAEGFTPELIDGLKKETSNRVESVLKQIPNVATEELDNLLRQTLEASVDEILVGSKSIDDVLSEFLTNNGKKLSQFYNPKELADYITQMKGALRQVDDRLVRGFGGDVSKVWDKMTLGQQRDFAKRSVEEITKSVPFGFKDLLNIKKLTNYIIKGADNEFSVKLFLKRIANVWKMSIGIQLVGLIVDGTLLLSQEERGRELSWQDKLDVILDGRSMGEFAVDMLIPFVGWAASAHATLFGDETYDELKAQLPIGKRDNIFSTEGGGYYYKEAGIEYPLEIIDNQWQIQFPNGEWFILSDIEL